MNDQEVLAVCQDPLITLVVQQCRAIELIRRGLRPKQVAMLTDLSIKRVRLLYGGLIPAEQRAARTPRSVSTIIRQSKSRIAASILVSTYRRVAGDSQSSETDKYELFVDTYDLYIVLAESLQEIIPILSIEDAFTIIHALRCKVIKLDHCEVHDLHYVLIKDHDRGRKCPNCAFELHKLDQQASADEIGGGGAMPHFGYRPATLSDETTD